MSSTGLSPILLDDTSLHNNSKPLQSQCTTTTPHRQCTTFTHRFSRPGSAIAHSFTRIWDDDDVESEDADDDASVALQKASIAVAQGLNLPAVPPAQGEQTTCTTLQLESDSAAAAAFIAAASAAVGARSAF